MKAEPIHRVLEPEVMDTQEEAAEYDAMDHSEVNRKFVQDFLATEPIGTDVLDLGTGTALIPVELCLQCRTVRVMASDAAVSMMGTGQISYRSRRFAKSNPTASWGFKEARL